MRLERGNIVSSDHYTWNQCRNFTNDFAEIICLIRHRCFVYDSLPRIRANGIVISTYTGVIATLQLQKQITGETS